MYECGFIGCGHMGGALAVAAAVSTREIALSNPTAAKAETLAARIGAQVTDNIGAAKNSRFILLGVKPQRLPEVAAQIAPVLRERKDGFTLVTMAAGVSIDSLIKMLGFNCPVIRIMPNTAVEIGEGMTLCCTNNEVTDGEMDAFLSLFAAAGSFDRIPESLIDAGSAVSGCGPAFVYMFIQAMADGGVECGLPRDKAVRYAAQTVLGAGKMVISSGQHPESLKDAVCSPAGSTIEGVGELERSAFRSAVMDAVAASFERTKELGKGK